MADRLFFKLQDGVTWEGVREGIKGKVVLELNNVGGDEEYAVAYVENGKVYGGRGLFSPSHYHDFAFRDLKQFLHAAAGHEYSDLYGIRRGSHHWRRTAEWPLPTSYNSITTTTNTQGKEVIQMAKAELYTVAAIWRPEYPTGTVINQEAVTHPSVIFYPVNFLARSEQEALAQAAQDEIVRGYVGRQDGQIDWQIRKTF